MRSPIERQLAYHVEHCRMRRVSEGRALEVFPGTYLRPRWPERLTCSIDCGPGWTDLIEGLNEVLDLWGAEGRFDGIKEKFGLLRLSWFGDDQGGRIDELTDAAEEISAMICERCGRRGMLRSTRAGGGWLSTSCEEHAVPGSSVVRAKSEGWL